MNTQTFLNAVLNSAHNAYTTNYVDVDFMVKLHVILLDAIADNMIGASNEQVEEGINNTVREQDE